VEYRARSFKDTKEWVMGAGTTLIHGRFTRGLTLAVGVWRDRAEAADKMWAL
jgi:hypothetical protein